MEYYIKEITITDLGDLSIEQKLRIERYCRRRVNINLGSRKLTVVRALDVIQNASYEILGSKKHFYDTDPKPKETIAEGHTVTIKLDYKYFELDFKPEREKKHDYNFKVILVIENVNKKKFVKALK